MKPTCVGAASVGVATPARNCLSSAQCLTLAAAFQCKSKLSLWANGKRWVVHYLTTTIWKRVRPGRLPILGAGSLGAGGLRYVSLPQPPWGWRRRSRTACLA